eukprot:GHVT01104606.1.p1 GENE.GHVT01104606.1~~GHVT01104606.1.p1  ORF type:complete len:103 (+),score=8.60 GHVT01104606.1:294-602(+)
MAMNLRLIMKLGHRMDLGGAFSDLNMPIGAALVVCYNLKIKQTSRHRTAPKLMSDNVLSTRLKQLSTPQTMARTDILTTGKRSNTPPLSEQYTADKLGQVSH